MDTFGDKLRRARERKGFSQTEVYKRTKINNKTLSRYEKNGSEPDYDSLKILCALYEVNVEDMIGGERINNYILELFSKITDPTDQHAAEEFLKHLAEKNQQTP